MHQSVRSNGKARGVCSPARGLRSCRVSEASGPPSAAGGMGPGFPIGSMHRFTRRPTKLWRTGLNLAGNQLGALDKGTHALPAGHGPDVGVERCPGVGGGWLTHSWPSIYGPDKTLELPGSRASTQQPRGRDGPHGSAHS